MKSLALSTRKTLTLFFVTIALLAIFVFHFEASVKETKSQCFANGLCLVVSLNITKWRGNTRVSMLAYMTNDKNANTSVTPLNADVPFLRWASFSVGCCGSCFPLIFALFTGYYSSVKSLSNAQPVYVFNPTSIMMCPALFNVSKIVFEPNSDKALLFYGNYTKGIAYMCVTFPPQTGLVLIYPQRSECVPRTIQGYWSQDGKFYPFSHENYTLVVIDLLNQSVILHFNG
ncbi:hypothetical protein B9Q13_04615 [Candidatus Marsarchaeota G2 archaeon ECH_B_SAG-G16]|uniref:Transmembrane protein n=1 Tax=Candidatus Marsarchaeota G2 archaeon ECH_B_SAG-G16 TaxID=1978167 RepID=A0A2R6C0M7_9ARCH|nr:MAG: hypothetical protein B9Q13_04615 [Candidatus Marsarchaeota G2 archaeon ECH_B_SAG-G16]